AGWRWQFWKFSVLAGAPLLLGSLACLAGGLLTDSFIRRTGNRKLGRRLFGVVGHSICALCYFACIFAPNAWLFILAVALAAFWNDLTMGSAWASCLDIGRKYSGIVSGCMNTVGNLGGFAAGFLTGWIVDLFKAPAIVAASQQTAATVGSLAGAAGGSLAGGLDYAAGNLGRLPEVLHQATEAARPGWTVNFLIFGGVYLVATFFWLRFDSTKPVLPDEPVSAGA